jgi:hypothetical protein
MLISPNIVQALEQIHSLTKGRKLDWLVGGSCGLLMQGVSLLKPPRDLDIYVDASVAPAIYEALKSYATDQLQYSKTDIYVSFLSHFRLLDVPIEIVGGFEVKAEQSAYKVDVSEIMLEFQVLQLIGDGIMIGLMPLAHELIFNLLRNRPDRYEAIASQMRTNPKYYLPALNKLLLHNTFSIHILTKINTLLNLKQTK